VPRAYPHLSQIEDQITQAALRLLWDRLYRCEDALVRVTARKAALERQLAVIPKLTRQMTRLESKARG
jgi:hypothetical protein